MQHDSRPARRTLLALTAAAAFGGFAATGMHLLLDTPASAQPATASTAIPATAALPNVVNGVTQQKISAV